MKTVYVPIQLEGTVVVHVPDETTEQEILDMIDWGRPTFLGNKMIDVTLTGIAQPYTKSNELEN